MTYNSHPETYLIIYFHFAECDLEKDGTRSNNILINHMLPMLQLLLIIDNIPGVVT